jgi:hypothetical protein
MIFKTQLDGIFKFYFLRLKLLNCCLLQMLETCLSHYTYISQILITYYKDVTYYIIVAPKTKLNYPQGSREAKSPFLLCLSCPKQRQVVLRLKHFY